MIINELSEHARKFLPVGTIHYYNEYNNNITIVST